MIDRSPHSDAGGLGSADSTQRTAGSPAPRCLTFAALGLMELDPLAAKIADHVHSLGHDLVNVTLLDKDELVVRATAGNYTDEMEGMRFPSRAGLGGLAVLRGRSVIVSNYAQVDWPLPLLDVMVEREGIRAAAGIPFFVNAEALGLLFIGRRRGGPLRATDVKRAQDVSSTVGPLLGASMQLARAVEAARADERQRVAHQVHDELIPLLFGIGAAARRTRDLVPRDAEVVRHVESIEAMASSANSLARNALSTIGQVRADEGLVLRIRASADMFTARTGRPVSFGVTGTPFPVGRSAAEALSGVVTEALNNVFKHAPASSVVLTLTFGADSVTVAVLDDGGGAATSDRVPRAGRNGTSGGARYGLASLKHRMALLGGSLEVGRNEDGGVTVRASVSALP
jgi:signal transduction histidine kinase